VTIRRLAELVRDAVETDLEIVHTDERDGDIEQSVADISRIQRDLGYVPTVDLNDGLAALAEASETK
jgi:UDP-glucose 4-epimerase